MKKYIEPAEVELITLDANDIVTASISGPSDNYYEEDKTLAPSRNYRGVEKGYEEEEW